MITQISKEGAAGSGLKRETDRMTYHKENALDLIELDLSLGFKPIVIKPDHIVLESYNGDCTWVEHHYYQGSPKDMQKLVAVAEASKALETIPA